MEKRQLGSSNLSISELGLGCMSLGTDEKHARAIIEAALEEGINYFDTADLYAKGMNEVLVGQVLHSVRDKVIIATKVGNRWNENGAGWRFDSSKKYIKEAVKQSLKRLDTDYIDLYQLHGGTLSDPIDETIEAFEELQAEGFIRYYGISSIRPTVIQEYVQKSNIVSVMMQYSILDRRPEEQALPLLKKNGISIVARGPLAKGLLSEAMLDKASTAVQEKGYLDYSFEDLQKVLTELKEKVAKKRSLTEISLQYLLADSGVTSVIAGASSIQQLKENVRAIMGKGLSAEELEMIHSLLIENQYQEHRL
ncbi:aldo/keto reductase [Cytobacillus sp. Hz8]|uniref:aldo/keto reductase n=1 Tax=Cytobacillus sp. Hz8 TaxID=3347168 RepID=UPI0035E0CA5B